MIAKIIKLQPSRHSGNLPDVGDDWTTQERAFINAKVRDYVNKGGKLNALALKAELAQATVSKLAYYETTRPANLTINKIIKALDLYEELGRQMIAFGRSRRGKS